MRARSAEAQIQGWFCPLIKRNLLLKRMREGVMQITDVGLEKYCAGCGHFWPFDTEFWFTCSSNADGSAHQCRACYLQRRWPNGRPSSASNASQGATT